MTLERALLSRVFLVAVLANVVGAFVMLGLLELRRRRATSE